jgi:hypothetical protein
MPSSHQPLSTACTGDKETQLSAAPGSPSLALPDSQRSGVGAFWHIFSQSQGEESEKERGEGEGRHFLNTGPGHQHVFNTHAQTLGLPPGSPSAPLFLLNDSSNHSQSSVMSGISARTRPGFTTERDEGVLTDADGGPVTSHPPSLLLAQPLATETGAAPGARGAGAGVGNKHLNRKLSFLTTSQAKELEEKSAVSGASSSSSFSFLSGL